MQDEPIVDPAVAARILSVDPDENATQPGEDEVVPDDDEDADVDEIG